MVEASPSGADSDSSSESSEESCESSEESCDSSQSMIRSPSPQQSDTKPWHSSPRKDYRERGFTRRRTRSPSPPRDNRYRSPCRVLGVFGLNYSTGRRMLAREFSRYGELDRVDLVCDPKGNSRGFAFISFRRIEDATLARSRLHDTIFDDKRIRVDYSTSRGPHPKTPGRYLGPRRRMDCFSRQVDRSYYGRRRSRTPPRYFNESRRRSPSPYSRRRNR